VVPEVKTIAVDDLNDLTNLIVVEDHRPEQTSLSIQGLGRQTFRINPRGTFVIGIGHASVLSVRPEIFPQVILKAGQLAFVRLIALRFFC
jgi:hypothetical protein